MRHARILDVLGAVQAIAGSHPEIEAWWYAPPTRLRLQGEIPGSASEAPSLEVVVEAAPRASPDCRAIAAELSRRLPGSPISVRPHRGSVEERQLFRLLSERSGRSAPEVASRPGRLGVDRTV